MDSTRELALTWYSLLSTLYAAVAVPLREMAAATDISVLSVLVFGLIGAASPCQITTNVSALAYLLRRNSAVPSPAWCSLAYLAGKAIVYMALGAAAILLGRQFEQASIPVVAAARRAVGPATILLALYLLGLIRLRFTVGERVSGWIERRAGPGSGGAFLLGAALALAFCPTLFLLFFGLTIPLALNSPAGLLYPAVFAAGTVLPLVAIAAVAQVLGASSTTDLPGASRGVSSRLRPVAAAAMLLAGINDTWLYWAV